MAQLPVHSCATFMLLDDLVNIRRVGLGIGLSQHGCCCIRHIAICPGPTPGLLPSTGLTAGDCAPNASVCSWAWCRCLSRRGVRNELLSCSLPGTHSTIQATICEHALWQHLLAATPTYSVYKMTASFCHFQENELVCLTPNEATSRKHAQ
jgi:hypothetical protein